jgi:hypothetical protein
MTLTRLLEVTMKFVKAHELASIGMAERIWREGGGPTSVRELTDLLEKTITDCRQCGIRYAPILLQRKKALQRGTWTPQVCPATLGGGTSELIGGDGGCVKCGGSGYMPTKGGTSMDLCPCEGWKKRSGPN